MKKNKEDFFDDSQLQPDYSRFEINHDRFYDKDERSYNKNGTSKDFETFDTFEDEDEKMFNFKLLFKKIFTMLICIVCLAVSIISVKYFSKELNLNDLSFKSDYSLINEINNKEIDTSKYTVKKTSKQFIIKDNYIKLNENNTVTFFVKNSYGKYIEITERIDGLVISKNKTNGKDLLIEKEKFDIYNKSGNLLRNVESDNEKIYLPEGHNIKDFLNK